MTSIFIELEGKYGIVENTSADEVIENIIGRIKSEKVPLSSFMQNISKSSVSKSGKYLNRSPYHPDYSKLLSYSLTFNRKIQNLSSSGGSLYYKSSDTKLLTSD